MCWRLTKIFQDMRPESWGGVALILLAWVLVAFVTHSSNFVPLGGDWFYPANHMQAERLIDIATSSWSGAFVNFLGSYQINLFPDALISALLAWIGLPYALLGTMALIYFSFLALCREMGIENPIAAIIGSILFTFSALLFDYFLMGWFYALVAISMLPLVTWAYLRALRGSNACMLLAGILFSLSPIQSQAVIWFMIVFSSLSFISLVKGDGWRRNAVVFCSVIVLFLIGNAYWIPMLLLYPPSYIVNSDLVSSATSIGTFANFSLVNALRAWGGLFNFQFETIVLKHGFMVFISFLAPFLAIIGIIGFRSRFKWGFSLLLIFPMIIEFLGMNRELIAYIPFGNVFRDVSRFLAISLFGTSVLAAMGASVILGSPFSRWRSWKLGVFITFILLGTYPWFSGAMWHWRDSSSRDIRLRIKEYPISWYRLNKKLSQESLNYKALYYPIGGTISFPGDPRFRGAYKEASDVFAGLSPIPGVFSISDRRFGTIDKLRSMLANTVPNRKELNMLSNLGVRLFIFRHNVTSPYPFPSKKLINKMLKSGEWVRWMSDKEVDVYAARRFNPPIYSIQDKSCKDSNSTIEYKKINSTLYRIRFHGLKCPVTLVLNETFNRLWKLRFISTLPSKFIAAPMDESEFKFERAGSDKIGKKELRKFVSSGVITGVDDYGALKFISRPNRGSIQNNNLPAPTLGELLSSSQVVSSHFVFDHFVNGWRIDPSRAFGNRENVDLFLEFKPQRVYIFGRYVSFVGIAIALFCMVLFKLLSYRIDRD